MHEKLIETIQTQTKDRFIDTTIRAKKIDYNSLDEDLKFNFSYI